MSIQPRAGTLTFGDFLELVREDQKADLLDGVIFMAPPESIAHNDLAGCTPFFDSTATLGSLDR